MLRNFPSDPFWEFGPPPPLPSLRKFSGSAHDPAILVHYIYLYFVRKIILPVTTKLENFESSVSRSLSPGLRLQSHIHCRMFFFFGSFTCLRWCHTVVRVCYRYLSISLPHIGDASLAGQILAPTNCDVTSAARPHGTKPSESTELLRTRNI